MKSAFACKLHIIFQCIIDPCIELKFSTPGGNRTPNLWNRNPTLYPIELQAHLHFMKWTQIYFI